MRWRDRAVMHGAPGGAEDAQHKRDRGVLRRLRTDDTGNVATGFLRVITLLAAFLAVAVVAGVLAAGLVLPAAAGAGYLTRSGTDYYDGLPTELEIPPLSQTSRMVAADGSLIATFFSENRSDTALNRMGEWTPKAIVAVEDERFFTHGGVDTRGTLRALGNNVLGGSQQGASTLTQQYVKQVQLESAVYTGDEEQVRAVQAEINANGPVGYGRKLREARLAISVEEQLTKDEILERYLNIANFGNATYGVQAAAQRYFSVNAEELTLPQAAALAGIVQLPTKWDPLDNPEGTVSRRNVVLSRMLSTGAITQQQYDESVASELALVPKETQRGCITSGQLAYFCDYVQSIILSDPAYGETPEARENLLNRGGLRIETTIRPDLQARAWEAVRSQVPETDRAGVAMSVVQPGTGQILAMAQNRTYGLDPAVPGQTTVNYNVDKKFNGGNGFQPGSNMKPFVLATWLEQGRPLNDRVPAPQERTFQYRDFVQCGTPLRRDGSTFPIGNSGGTAPSLSIAEATFKSSNTAYLEITSQLDLCQIRDVATRLGIHPASDPDGEIGMTANMALGPFNVAPLSMAGAYATFAADGVHCNSVAITRIADRTGADLPVPVADCTQALDPQVARGVNEVLQQTLIQGTAKSSTFSAGIAAGKTGTTNEFKEVWFSGYTPGLAASVWVGDPGVDGNPQPLTAFPINGKRLNRVFGSTIALPTWDTFMNRANEVYDLRATGFPEPDADIREGPQFAVPDVVGDSPGQAESQLQGLGLRTTVAGEARFSDSVSPGDVAAQNPSSGALERKGGTVTLYLSKGPEPAPPPPPPVPVPDPVPDFVPDFEFDFEFDPALPPADQAVPPVEPGAGTVDDGNNGRGGGGRGNG